MFDYPNVVIIPPNDETPETIIERYLDIIPYNLERGENLKEVLYMLFDDANRWTSKQFLIDLAGQTLQELEDIKAYEDEINEDFEEEFEGDE